MGYTLKDGTVVEDPRLDRLRSFDPRSANFRVGAAFGFEPVLRGRTHPLYERLNQGYEGACVGFGITHDFLAYPARFNVSSEEAGNIFAKKRIYYRAQKRDEWPGGAYPGASPFYEGTSVLAGMKVAKNLGFYNRYLWAFTIDEVITAIVEEGPVVVGTWWKDSMYNTRPSGLIDISGSDQGGHCWLIRGFLTKPYLPGESNLGPVFRCVNSWGRDWGVDGEFYIKVEDFEALLKAEGEAALPVGRKVPTDVVV